MLYWVWPQVFCAGGGLRVPSVTPPPQALIDITVTAANSHFMRVMLMLLHSSGGLTQGIDDDRGA